MSNINARVRFDAIKHDFTTQRGSLNYKQLNKVSVSASGFDIPSIDSYKKIDLNNDGKVTISESIKTGTNHQQLRNAFERDIVFVEGALSPKK
jgi:hypothetical protein